MKATRVTNSFKMFVTGSVRYTKELCVSKGDDWVAKIKTIEYLNRLCGESESLWLEDRDE